MTGNTLREAIEAIEYPKPEGTNVDPEFVITVGRIIPEEVIDAILDAVICAMPKRVDMARLDGLSENGNEGYNSAITEVISLLEEAKSK